MPKITIHIDDQLFEQILKAANKERLSMPAWITNKLRLHVNPIPRFDSSRIFGSVHDIDHDYHYPDSVEDENVN